MFSLCLKVARETNEELRNIKAFPSEGFDVGAILSIARRYISPPFTSPCSNFFRQWYRLDLESSCIVRAMLIFIDVSLFLSWVRVHDCCFYWLIRQLSSEHEATRIEALHWISTLLNRHRTEVTIIGHFLFCVIDNLSSTHLLTYYLSFELSLISVFLFLYIPNS